jgi:hypothetical protein
MAAVTKIRFINKGSLFRRAPARNIIGHMKEPWVPEVNKTLDSWI